MGACCGKEAEPVPAPAPASAPKAGATQNPVAERPHAGSGSGDPLAKVGPRKSTAGLPEQRTKTEFRRARAKRLAVAAEALADGAEIEITKVPKTSAEFEFIAKAVSENLLFNSLPQEARTAIIMSMSKQTFAAGQDIIVQGDTVAETFYVLESGTCDVLVKEADEGEDPSTAEERKVHTYTGSSCFGDLALLYNAPRVATVRAASGSALWVMERKAYTAIKRTYQEQLEAQKKSAVDACPIFAVLSDERRGLLLDALEPVQFENGEYIFHKGDVGDKFYIVQDGIVSISDDGREVASLNPGKFFGERALMADETRAASAFAKGDGARLLFLNRQAFVDLLGPISDVWRFESLRTLPILAALTDAQLTNLLGVLTTVEVAAGQAVFNVGDKGDELFIVEEGEMVVIDGTTGSELARYQKGKCFGELALLRQDVRAATVKANTAGRLLSISREAFEQVLGGSLSALRLAFRVQSLRSVPLLRALKGEQLSRTADALKSVSFQAGATIFNSGDPGDTFYIVQAGSVEVLDSQGKGAAILGPGSYFGERALLMGEPRAATIRAVHNCELLSLGRSDFEGLLGPLQALMDKQLGSYESLGGAGPGKLDVKNVSDLDRIAVLGLGAFGKVYLCKYKGQVYALKTLRKAQILQAGLHKHVVRERDVMMECDCPFMVNLMATFKDKEYLYMLMESVMGGELFTYLSGKNGVPEKQARFYTACVVMAFEYLQQRNYVYRDLKPENLLLDPAGYVKVADFGFAKKVERGKTFTMCGTPDYLAPELVQQTGHNRAVDWWALGVLIFELTAGFPPFSGADQVEQMSAILACRFSFPAKFSKEVRDAIKKLLTVNAAKRLGMLKGGAADVKKHLWFREMDWDAMYEKKIKAPYVPKLSAVDDTSCFDEYDLDEEHPGASFNSRKKSMGVFDAF